jgi:hypothetical protein
MRTLILFLAAISLSADCPPYGPDYCLNDPAYPQKLKQKKQTLKVQGYPDDLIALLDKDGHCVAAVAQSPDGFSVLTVKSNGDRLTIAWTKQAEDSAKQQLLSGQIAAYYKMNSARALACAGEKKAEERADWSASLMINLGLAIKCTKAGNSVSCAPGA